MEALKSSAETLFILLGAIMVLAMHAGFAFLELGTVRKKNQVNALVKILTDFASSTVAYFFIGYTIAYGVSFFVGAEALAQKSGYGLVKFFFLLDVRRRDSRDRLRRHRRARALRSADRCDVRARRRSSIRSSRASRGTAASASRGGSRRCPARSSTISPAASSCTRSAAGSRWPPCCCSARAAAATRKDGGGRRASAVADSVSRPRRLGALGWLVRLQRDERADVDKISGLVAVNSLMAMAGGTLRGAGRRPQRPGLRPQRAARRAGRRSAQARTSCIRSARSSPARVAGAIFVVDCSR